MAHSSMHGQEPRLDAVAEGEPMPRPLKSGEARDHATVWVDMTWIGRSPRFSAKLGRESRGTVKAGDLAWVVDDSVPPRLFRIKALSGDGIEASLELASLAGSDGQVTNKEKENA